MSDTIIHTPDPVPVGHVPAPSREKLIEAAARVYAAVGFRGATTRRIAEEAGVNEVTIFRLFGSKAALIDAAMRQQAAVPHDCPAALPDPPVNPERELTAWCEAQLTLLRTRRCLIRQTMEGRRGRVSRTVDGVGSRVLRSPFSEESSDVEEI